MNNWSVTDPICWVQREEIKVGKNTNRCVIVCFGVKHHCAIEEIDDFDLDRTWEIVQVRLFHSTFYSFQIRSRWPSNVRSYTRKSFTFEFEFFVLFATAGAGSCVSRTQFRLLRVRIMFDFRSCANSKNPKITVVARLQFIAVYMSNASTVQCSKTTASQSVPNINIIIRAISEQVRIESTI